MAVITKFRDCNQFVKNKTGAYYSNGKKRCGMTWLRATSSPTVKIWRSG